MGRRGPQDRCPLGAWMSPPLQSRLLPGALGGGQSLGALTVFQGEEPEKEWAERQEGHRDAAGPRAWARARGHGELRRGEGCQRWGSGAPGQDTVRGTALFHPFFLPSYPGATSHQQAQGLPLLSGGCGSGSGQGLSPSRRLISRVGELNKQQ